MLEIIYQFLGAFAEIGLELSLSEDRPFENGFTPLVGVGILLLIGVIFIFLYNLA